MDSKPTNSLFVKAPDFRHQRAMPNLIAYSLLLVLLVLSTVQAQDFYTPPEPEPGQSTHADDESWQFDFDAYLEFVSRYEKDFDLRNDEADDISTSEPEAGFSLTIDSGNLLTLYFETELSRVRYVKNEPDKDDKDWELNIEQIFVDLNASDHLTFRVGRQRFKDEMEWYYDSFQDGVRAFYRRNSFELEVAAVQENTFDGELLDNVEEEDDEESDNLVLVAHYKPTNSVNLSAYVISIDESEIDDNNHEDLLFFGVQSVGKFTPGFKHWLNAAYVEGDRVDDGETFSVDAYGYDIGGTFIVDSPSQPSFTLGYAYGSGDSDRNEGTDTNFRQTGLEDNNYRFNGVTKFKYLGELFDPEITNISIVTAGFGIRPTEKSSIDLVLHQYTQAEAVDRLRGTNIERDPQGENKDLGYELDIIYGNREHKNVYFEGVVGLFTPGDAFNSNADNAYYAYLELGYKF